MKYLWHFPDGTSHSQGCDDCYLHINQDIWHNDKMVLLTVVAINHNSIHYQIAEYSDTEIWLEEVK